VAAIIYPIKINMSEVMSVLLFGVISVVLIMPLRDGVIRRWRGWVLLSVYLAYLIVVLEK